MSRGKRKFFQDSQFDVLRLTQKVSRDAMFLKSLQSVFKCYTSLALDLSDRYRCQLSKYLYLAN